MIRALIVDDEPVARRRIRRLLGGQADVIVSGECASGAEAIQRLANDRIDVVFLDVQMPDIDGFEVVRAIGAAMPAVVFVTAFDQYAIGAFEVHALDYLLKPFSRARFQQSIGRVRRELERRSSEGAAGRLDALIQELSERRYLSRLVVKSAGKVLLLDAARVDWIEAADNYAVVHAGSATHIIRETLQRLAVDLDPQQFVRVHRSAIVRLDRVEEFQPAFHGDFVIRLRDGTRVAMSRSYRAAVEEVLGRPL
jgi:two-component system, LytTR family, response regulator